MARQLANTSVVLGVIVDRRPIGHDDRLEFEEAVALSRALVKLNQLQLSSVMRAPE